MVDFIRIVNKSKLSDDLIKSRIRAKSGRKLDLDQLEQDISNIYGLDYFNSVEYQIVMEGEKTGIEIIAKEKTQGLDSFRFGLNLENDFDGDSAHNLTVRYQKEGLNSLGGELVVQAIAGEKIGALVGFVQPLDSATRYIVAPSFNYLENDVPTFENGSRIAEFRVKTAEFGLSFSRQLANWGAVSVGINHGWGWSDVQIGSSTQPDNEFGIGEYFTRVNYDTIDNLSFPNTGTKLSGEFRRSSDNLGADESFSTVSASALTARTWESNTGLLRANMGTTFSGEAPVQNLFALGGLFNLSGFQADELSGQDFALGQMIYYRNIGARPGSFGVPVYLGLSLEAGNVWQANEDMAFDDLILAGSLFVGLDTILGPIYLAYGRAEHGNDSAYLFLGQTF
jgi:NTE family protein